MSGQKKILIVDDNAANLTVINGVLSGKYKAYPVDSGETAIKFLERMRPDLILLDVEMPGMNGIELFEIIKTDGRLTGIPVVFLTGNDTSEFEAGIFRLGASDYIRKPINDVILLSKVEMHLELAALRAAIKNHPELMSNN